MCETAGLRPADADERARDDAVWVEENHVAAASQRDAAAGLTEGG